MDDDLPLKAITQPLPTADEILAGTSQGGVPRPSFLKDDEDDGTVHSVVPAAIKDRLNT